MVWPSFVAPPMCRRRAACAGQEPGAPTETDPSLLDDLRALVEPATRGDPERPLLWTAKSLRNLAGGLQELGHRISFNSVRSLLGVLGYSLQANRKTREGTNHPDRDAQFGYINDQVKAALAADEPGTDGLGWQNSNRSRINPTADLTSMDRPTRHLAALGPHQGSGAMIANVLTIAGSDPSGGAGIQADLKTFSALGAYGTTVVTALTAQNTRGVRSFQVVEASFVADQIDAIYDDVRIDAVKIGMVATAEIAAVIAQRLAHHRACNVVLDPVMVAKSGDRLLAEDAIVLSIRILLRRFQRSRRRQKRIQRAAMDCRPL